jgi:1-acyl-sn-glycerol-3-phosphate acyltransferase
MAANGTAGGAKSEYDRPALSGTGGWAPSAVFPSSVIDAPRPPEVLERQLIVRAGKVVTRAFATRFHDLRVLTPCPIPPTGGAILVCNHTSSIDPVFLQAACPRLITWMMAKEYRNLFGVGWFFDAIEPILVERSGKDMAATRAALRALNDGKVLGLFPEGKIENSHELLDFQTGVALLALKSGAPVYPAYLDGMQRRRGMLEAFITPGRTTLAFGPPVQLDQGMDGREGLEAATRQIRDAVAVLAQIRSD